MSVFTGVPSFFRCGCLTARSGGNFSYEIPGQQLASHVRELEPHTVSDDEEWSDECDKLDDAAFEQNDQAVLEWFLSRYPRCMELIPTRRRTAFLRGVYRIYADD